jgi:hypothetical protein
VKLLKLTPYNPSRDRSALSVAVNPSAADGSTINCSSCIWAMRPPGQDARNGARKEWESLKPEVRKGVLFGRSPAGGQALATWAFSVVTFGLTFKGPDISLDMCLLVVSIQTPISDGFESMAVCISGQLG